MALKLYHTPLTRSIRVLWTLEELGLPYELVVQPMDRSYFRTPEWRAINPVGKLPVFFDGDERIIESTAIIHYLSEKYGEGRLARRPTDSDYGQFLQWLHFGEGGMGGYAGMLIGQTRILPPEHRIEAMKQWAIGECRNCCNFIETSLEGKSFLLGEDFSLADISVGYILHLIRLSGEGKAIIGERTRAYYDRLADRPAWKKATA
ncbi:MAG: glutathione S-transferase family protein [Pseudomonadota bacterium]|nr:glutathione S-transferase family protein [Pseudomonadota bacterium]